MYIATVLPFHSAICLSVHGKSTCLQMAGRHELWWNVNTSFDLSNFPSTDQTVGIQKDKDKDKDKQSWKQMTIPKSKALY